MILVDANILIYAHVSSFDQQQGARLARSAVEWHGSGRPAVGNLLAFLRPAPTSIARFLPQRPLNSSLSRVKR